MYLFMYSCMAIVNLNVQVHLFSQNANISFKFCSVKKICSSRLVKNGSAETVMMFLSISCFPHKHKKLSSDQWKLHKSIVTCTFGCRYSPKPSAF